MPLALPEDPLGTKYFVVLKEGHFYTRVLIHKGAFTEDEILKYINVCLNSPVAPGMPNVTRSYMRDVRRDVDIWGCNAVLRTGPVDAYTWYLVLHLLGRGFDEGGELEEQT